MDLIDHAGETDGVGLTRAGTAAAYVDRGNKGAGGEQHRHARAEPLVMGIADADTGDVGDQIAGAGHALSGRCCGRERASESSGGAVATLHRLGPFGQPNPRPPSTALRRASTCNTGQPSAKPPTCGVAATHTNSLRVAAIYPFHSPDQATIGWLMAGFAEAKTVDTLSRPR